MRAVASLAGAALLAAVAGVWHTKHNPAAQAAWPDGHTGSVAAPPSIDPTPSASFFGDGEFHVLRVFAAERVSSDAAADLLVYQQPDGLVSMRAAYAVAGRENWPRSARLAALGPSEIRPPAARTGDSVEIVGTGDLNGDGQVDFAGTRTQYPGISPVPREIYVYLGPDGPVSGAFRTPDITIELPEPVRCRVRIGDITGDGLGEFMILDDVTTRVLAGRAEWPARLRAEPMTVIEPPANEIFTRDLTGDGVPDALFNVDSNNVDVAMLTGRADWSPTYNLLTDSDWTAGTGRVQFEVGFLADLNADDQVDIAIVEGDAPQLLILEGPIPTGGRPLPEGADWAIGAIDLTTRDTEAAEMTGDSIDELLVNGMDVFLGLEERTGSYGAGSDDVAARWEVTPYDYLFAADVTGDGNEDVIVNEVNGDGQGRERGAGAVRIYNGPILPTPDVSPTPRSTATPTATSDLPTPTASPTRTATAAAVGTIYLPACETARR